MTESPPPIACPPTPPAVSRPSLRSRAPGGGLTGPTLICFPVAILSSAAQPNIQPCRRGSSETECVCPPLSHHSLLHLHQQWSDAAGPARHRSRSARQGLAVMQRRGTHPRSPSSARCLPTCLAASDTACVEQQADVPASTCVGCDAYAAACVLRSMRRWVQRRWACGQYRIGSAP